MHNTIRPAFLGDNYVAKSCCFTGEDYECASGTPGSVAASCEGYELYCEGGNTMENRHAILVPACTTCDSVSTQ